MIHSDLFLVPNLFITVENIASVWFSADPLTVHLDCLNASRLPWLIRPFFYSPGSWPLNSVRTWYILYFVWIAKPSIPSFKNCRCEPLTLYFLNNAEEVDMFTLYTIYLIYRCGASGDEIIEALISNSSTFEKKTAFSQVALRLAIVNLLVFIRSVLMRTTFTGEI